jgi:hypothetical protein
MKEFITTFINNCGLDIIEGSDNIYIEFNLLWDLKLTKFFKHISNRYYDVNNIYNLIKAKEMNK